eukprot:3597797-Prymnesium_polylepis.1
MVPDVFQTLCAFSPGEFEKLHTDVLNVLEKVRDVGGVHGGGTFTEAENSLRKKRRYKFSSRERLFQFLVYARNYPRLRKGGTDFGMCKASLLIDFVWLREQLSVHPLM